MSHPTHDALLDAGVAVAEREGLAGLSVNRVVAQADLPVGAERLVAGAEAYLDVSLSDRAVKALALEARTDPRLSSLMSARHDRFAALTTSSFRAMGWPDAPAAAQLLAAMTQEIAVREFDAGRRLPASRRALRRYLAATS